jgi:hypothetical protein
MARKRQRSERRNDTYVQVLGSKLILHLADGDVDGAMDCLENNGKLTFTFGELVVRQFPTDMTFEPATEGGSKAPVSEPVEEGGLITCID